MTRRDNAVRVELRLPPALLARIERYRAGKIVPSYSRNGDICVLLDRALSEIEGQGDARKDD